MAKIQDKYANIMAVTVPQSAVSTITFTEFNMGLNIFDKVGLVIQRIEYTIPLAIVQEIVATPDFVEMAVTSSNQIPTLGATEEALLDRKILQVNANSALAIVELPLITDWSNLPAGGMIAAPRPLYASIDSGGISVVINLTVRIFFQMISLSQGDYLELLETRRFLGV